MWKERQKKEKRKKNKKMRARPAEQCKANKCSGNHGKVPNPSSDTAQAGWPARPAHATRQASSQATRQLPITFRKPSAHLRRLRGKHLVEAKFVGLHVPGPALAAPSGSRRLA